MPEAYLSRLEFEACPAEHAAMLLRALQAQAPRRFARVRIGEAQSAVLPFYGLHRLVDLRLEGVTAITRAFLLEGPRRSSGWTAAPRRCTR